MFQRCQDWRSLQTYFGLTMKILVSLAGLWLSLMALASICWGCAAPTYSANSLHAAIVEILPLMVPIFTPLFKTGLIMSTTSWLSGRGPWRCDGWVDWRQPWCKNNYRVSNLFIWMDLERAEQCCLLRFANTNQHQIQGLRWFTILRIPALPRV